ncbi:hypothetical protein ES702_05104 [subsurface metagenome]
MAYVLSASGRTILVRELFAESRSDYGGSWRVDGLACEAYLVGKLVRADSD